MALTVILSVGAYLCGGLPFGVWFARVAGVDLRRSGSGNIGATNVARTAGWRLALLTLAGDAAKGFLPVFLAQTLGRDTWIVALVGLAAVCGHLFSFLLKFHGGKGVATAAGVLLAISPLVLAPAVAIFAAVVLSTRYVSLGSIVAALTLPLSALLLGYDGAVQALGLALAALIVWRHIENIKRLLSGHESQFHPSRRS